MATDVWTHSALYQTCVMECGGGSGGWEAPEALDAGTLAALRALATAEAPPWHAIFTLSTTKTLHPALAALTDADLADLVRVIDAHGFPVAWAQVVREEAGVRHGLLPRGMLGEAMRRFDVARNVIEDDETVLPFPYELVTGAHTAASAPWLACISAGLWRPPTELELERYCGVSSSGVNNWVVCLPVMLAVTLGHTHLLPHLCTLPVPHMSWRIPFVAAWWQNPKALDVLEWLHEHGHWPAGEVKQYRGPFPKGRRGAAWKRLVDKGVVTVV